jgi:4-amino-4-deoxy-L-arabinose transferase-like glycosyltransferase
MRVSIPKLMNRYQPPLILSVVLCLCLNILFSFIIYPLIEQPFHAQQDVDRYAEIGQNLYRGNGFRFEGADMPTVSRGPIYPLTIAALSWVAGGFAIWHIQLLQALFLAGACVLIFFVARQIFSAGVAHWAALAMALYPLCIWYAARVWTESLLVLGVSFLAYRLVRFHRAPTFGRGIMLGIVSGLLILVKAGFLLFIPFLLLYYSVTKNFAAVRHCLLALVCAVVIVLPWTVRNHRVSDSIIPVQTTAASNYLIGNTVARDFFEHPLSLSVPMQKGTEEIARSMDEAGLSPLDAEEAAGENVLRPKAIESFRSDPIFLVKKLGIQAFTFWYLGEVPLKSIVLLLVQIPVLIFALRKIRKTVRESALVVPLILIIIYWWGIAALFVAHARIAVPIMPLVLLLAVYGMYRRA